MAQTSGFFNAQLDGGGNFDRVYLAEQFAEYFSNFIGNGVFEGQLNQLQVVANSGLTVNVGTGKAFCKGFWYKNSEVVTLTIDTPDGVLNRIDNIVLRFDFAQRITSLAIVKGTPASAPVAPSLTRTGSVYELKLAQVYVGASVSAITQSNITDTRSDNTVCGWVTGLITQVDTTTLFNQWEAAYQESLDDMTSWEVDQKAAFDTWFSTLTTELGVASYIQQFVKTVILGVGQSRTIALDMTGYTYNARDMITVTINGLDGIQGVDWTLNANQGTITVNCNGSLDTINIKVWRNMIGVQA